MNTTQFGLTAIFAAVLMFFVNHVVAVEQFSQPQCQQLSNDLTEIRVQQRQGLKLADSERMKANELQLTQQLHYHCASPQITTSQPQRTQHLKRRPRQAAQAASRPPKALTFSTIVHKSSYQGRQLQAWLNFYREPHFCFGVRLTELMVICAELRQQAQREFEQRWQQQPDDILSDQ